MYKRAVLLLFKSSFIKYRDIIVVTCSILFLLTLIPLKALALETNGKSNLNAVQEKVANGYAKKFCNAIGMGLSKESSIMLTIRENESPKFNPSLWSELVFSGEEKIEALDEEQLTDLISTKISNKCGYPIGISNETDKENFKEYFQETKARLREVN